MARQINILAGLFAALIVGAASVGVANAQDCPRGDLDKAYCDRDGDLVADAPTDPKQLVNPSTLIFAYTPVEDPAVYAKAWDGFVKYMEQTTGKKVVFFPVQSNAAEIEAMRSGRLHVAGFNTGSNPIAVNCAGFVPFAMMGTKDGQFGYEMELIVPADSPIKTPADLKGKKVAFTSPTSNSGFKAPSTRSGRFTSPRPSRPPATATPTISIRRWSRKSSRPFSPSRGRALRSRRNSRSRTASSRSPIRRTGA